MSEFPLKTINSMSHRFIPHLVCLLIVGCASPEIPPPVEELDSVWAVDLIKILPGGGPEYLANIEGNWAQARDIAIKRGAVLSFRALIAEPDSTREWDLILMTEYADSSWWANREEVFVDIFGSAEFERIPMARPSSELREFVAGGVVLSPVVSGGKR